MTRRLLVSYLTVTLVVLVLLEVPLAVFYSQRELERFTALVERDASVLATLFEDSLEAGALPDPAPAEQYAARTGARVVVTDADGIARIDTEQPVPRDFSTRPEIATALSGSRSSGSRWSNTLGTDLVYAAVPVASSGVVHGVLRLTVGAGRIDARIHRFWWGLVGIGAVVLAVMALVGWLIARSLTFPIRRLNETAARFSAGDLTIRGTEADHGPPELRALGDSLQVMAGRLSEMLDEQRAFVADASHQLRTPLTALRLRLENLQSRLGDPEATDLDTAIEETSRLAALVTDLLQLARADEHRAVVGVDLASLAAERVDTWAAVAESKDVRLELDCPPGPVLASAVPGAVEQILDNTLDNALEVSPPGGRVTVTVRAGARTHILSVLDEGPGLADEDKARAVRRFWRGTAERPGTGLGLSIADALARASGGSLRLLDGPTGGLLVEVELPRGRAETAPGAARHSP